MKIKNELHDQWRAGLVEYVLLDASLREAEKAGEGAGELRRRAMEIMRFDEGEEELRLLRGNGCVCLAFSSGISFLGLAAATDTPENTELLYLFAPEWIARLKRKSMTEHLDRYLLLDSFERQKLCAIYLRQNSASGRAAWLLHEGTRNAELLYISQCGDGVGALLSFESYDMLCEDLNELSVREKCNCGISPEYDRQILAVGSLDKARRAACFEGYDAYFRRFSDLRWECFLREAKKALVETAYAMEDFVHSALSAMRNYDRSNGTEYFQSVYAYLLCGKNLREAAAMLEIHRNTLDYRVKRASALFGLELSDSGLCFELLFSYMLGLSESEEGEGAELSRGQENCILWQAFKRERPPLPVSRAMYVLLRCDISSLDGDERLNFFVELAGRFPQCCTAFDDSTLLALFRTDSECGFECADDCSQLLMRYGCRASLSGCFSMERINAAIGITEAALAMGPGVMGERSLYRVEQMASFLLFAQLEKNMQLSVFYCDEVMRVLQHDYENATELANSLYVYLSSFMNLKKAAKETSLHRNTVEYRVKKIQKYLDIENAERELLFEMLCTYHMLAADCA